MEIRPSTESPHYDIYLSAPELEMVLMSTLYRKSPHLAASMAKRYHIAFEGADSHEISASSVFAFFNVNNYDLSAIKQSIEKLSKGFAEQRTGNATYLEEVQAGAIHHMLDMNGELENVQGRQYELQAHSILCGGILTAITVCMNTE